MDTFTESEYRAGVEGLLESFETTTGRSLEPGENGRVGLNLYTHSGPGLATPRDLVRAVVAALEKRGYRRENVFLVGKSAYRLRQAGFLSRTERPGEFEGSPVYVLETGVHYDGEWYYESPLPPRTDFRRFPGLGLELAGGEEAVGDDRLSHLPYPLLHEVDFWINLPRYTDHRNLGVSGALLNATLWNSGNTSRFLNSSATGPVAAAEMAAIPELRRGWLLNIVTLESFQFIGGPTFRSLYTASEPALWMSADPVLLDALMVRKMDRHRESRGFPEIGEYVPLLEFAEQLGVGRSDPDAARWIRVR